MSHSRYDGLRCPHCSGKLLGYVSRDAELARIREETQKDAEVVRLSNQLAGAVSLLREAHGWVDAAGEDLCRPEAEELAARIAAFLAIPGGQ